MKREEIKRLSFLISERDRYIAELDFIRKELKGKDESSWHLKVIAECEEIRHEMDTTFRCEDKVIEFCENLAKENIKEIDKELAKYNVEL